MRTTKYFLVKPAVADRAGVLNQRYHTQQGLMVLNEQDMGKIRLEPEEYLTGVVEQVVSEDEAAQLIEQAGRVLGPLVKEQEQPSGEVPEESPEESSEQLSSDEQSESESAEQPEVEQSEIEQQQAEEGQKDE